MDELIRNMDLPGFVDAAYRASTRENEGQASVYKSVMGLMELRVRSGDVDGWMDYSSKFL